MPFLVQCPNASCGKKYSMTDDSRGRSYRCKVCSTRFEAIPQDTVAPRETATPSPESLPVPPRLSSPTGPPERVGRYLLRDPLGAGSFGTVYRAHDPQLDRDVALKVLRPEVLDSTQAVERFQREAKAVAKLHHPSIVPVYDCGRDGEHHFIAYALIEGRSLADAIDPGGIEPTRAARLVARLAEGLAYAHERGILHRDIKPANVMLDAADHPILVDFGLARHAAANSLTALTRTGMVMGTPAYMAPEQLGQEALTAGPTADLYSLGVTLYHLLTGTIPFRGPIQAVMAQILFQAPPPPHMHRPDLDPRLEAICLKAMGRKPENRFASARELAAALDTWLTSSARTVADTPPATPPVAPRRRRAPLVAACILLALVLCGVVGWRLYPTIFGGGDSTPTREEVRLPLPKGPQPTLMLWPHEGGQPLRLRVFECETVVEKRKRPVQIQGGWAEEEYDVVRYVPVCKEMQVMPEGLQISDCDGKPLDRKELRQHRPVLFSADGETVDPYFLAPFKRNTPVVRLPGMRNATPFNPDTGIIAATGGQGVAFLDDNERVVIRLVDVCSFPEAAPPGPQPPKMMPKDPKAEAPNLGIEFQFVNHLADVKEPAPAVEPIKKPVCRLVPVSTEYVLDAKDVRFLDVDGAEVARDEWIKRLAKPTQILLSYDGPLAPAFRAAIKDDVLILVGLPFMHGGPIGGPVITEKRPENNGEIIPAPPANQLDAIKQADRKRPEKPALDKPGGDKQRVDKPALDRPGSDKPSADKP